MPQACPPWRLIASASLLVIGACTNQSPPTPDPSPHFLRESSGIRGLFEGSNGIFYITSTDWTAQYDPNTADHSLSPYTYFEDRGAGVLVSGFQEDDAGQLYSQSANGIFRYDGEAFTPIPRDYTQKHAWAMAPGDLWFGADGGVALNEEENQWGGYRLRAGAVTFLAFPEPPAGERAKFYALTSQAMPGKNGKLWFGTFNAAYGFDGASWEIIGRERLGMAEDPRHMGIRGYHMDHQGNLWMADNGMGYFVYNGEEVLHFTAHHNLEDADTDGPSLHRAFSVSQDADGNYWFGTVYSGLWRYEPSVEDPLRKGTFTHYGPEQGWPCENTWTIYTSRSGELLFCGEKPGGVYRFNGEGFERVF